MTLDTTDVTTCYAQDVAAGRILAGRLVRLACARHLRDLEDGPARGLRFSSAAAGKALSFFALLNLPTGGPFKLHPSQAFIVGSIFGWLKEDGTRRFVTCYVEQGKGNGKSPLAAALGLFGLWMDSERAAEIYVCASKEDQALVTFRDALGILRETPALKRRFDVGIKNIAHLPTGSFMRVIGSDGDTQSGPRPHFAIADEVHEHTSDRVIDMMRAGFKFRRQPLLLAFTNSGFDKETVCGVYHDHSEKVLTGALQDDTWYAYVCTLDPCAAHAEEGKSQPVDGCADCDDWRNEAVWPKTNPLLGTTIRSDYLRRQVAGAIDRPTEEGKVKRLNMCLWTSGETQWLPAALWARGNRPIDTAALAGREASGGLDMAARLDVCAFVLCFKDCPEQGDYALVPHFWIPEATADARQQKDGIPWRVWARQGLVTLVPGDVIDPDLIEKAVVEAFGLYSLKGVRYDPWNALATALHLQSEGVEMIEFAQTIRNFNEPCKQMEVLLKEGKIVHGGHPVLAWMASNAVAHTDANGNVRPIKPSPHSPKKIDGVVASLLALSGALLAEGSWYVPGILTH